MKAWCDSENTIKTFDFYTKTLFIDFLILTSMWKRRQCSACALRMKRIRDNWILNYSGSDGCVNGSKLVTNFQTLIFWQ